MKVKPRPKCVYCEKPMIAPCFKCGVQGCRGCLGFCKQCRRLYHQSPCENLPDFDGPWSDTCGPECARQFKAKIPPLEPEARWFRVHDHDLTIEAWAYQGDVPRMLPSLAEASVVLHRVVTYKLAFLRGEEARRQTLLASAVAATDNGTRKDAEVLYRLVKFVNGHREVQWDWVFKVTPRGFRMSQEWWPNDAYHVTDDPKKILRLVQSRVNAERKKSQDREADLTILADFLLDYGDNHKALRDKGILSTCGHQ
jgi:hypothetical protein